MEIAMDQSEGSRTELGLKSRPAKLGLLVNDEEGKVLLAYEHAAKRNESTIQKG